MRVERYNTIQDVMERTPVKSLVFSRG